MRSWSHSFADRVATQREDRNRRPMGFVTWYQDDMGPITVAEAIAKYGRAHVMSAAKYR